MQLSRDASQMILVEKYRPQTVEECILPKALKEKLTSYASSGEFPHLIFTGRPGVGKSTVAKALAKQLGSDYLFITASKDGNIDTLRNIIQQFASTVSITSDQRKIVHLDEADNLSHHFQPALRAFIEEYSANCVFILTVNYPQRLLPPLRDSRFALIEFKIPPSEKASLQAETFKRVVRILDNENVTYTKEVVAQLVHRYFPDIRRILNEIDGSIINHQLDDGVLATSSEEDWTELYKAMKSKSFTDVRKWVGLHGDIETPAFFRRLYVDLASKLTDDSVPYMIILLAKYQYQAAFVADAEINNTACLTEIMAECAWT